MILLRTCLMRARQRFGGLHSARDVPARRLSGDSVPLMYYGTLFLLVKGRGACDWTRLRARDEMETIREI